MKVKNTMKFSISEHIIYVLCLHYFENDASMHWNLEIISNYVGTTHYTVIQKLRLGRDNRGKTAQDTFGYSW